MNYQRVYEEFIADRRLKEHLLVSGYDTHHIRPVSFGGKDNPENLIKLSYSDHLFAHALLAEILGGAMITTAARMSGMSKYIGRKPRAKYQAARNRHREKMLGNSHTLGRKMSPEFGKAVSKRLQGNKHKQGKPASEAIKLASSKTAVMLNERFKNDPEFRAMHIARMKAGHRVTDEQRAASGERASKQLKELWSNTEYREKKQAELKALSATRKRDSKGHYV